MPNGKAGDNPITDLTIHSQHPFPKDIEEMILQLLRVNPTALDDTGFQPFDWERGKNLDGARKLLKKKLIENGISE